MNMDKLFESLDAKVFTPELKESLEAQFNEAVELRAQTIADARIEEEIERLSTKSEEHISMLEEKASEYAEIKAQELEESVSKYLDRVVEEFVAEAKESLQESLKSEKADMIIEATEAMLVATGVEISKIVEAKDNSEVSKELEESVSKNDKLVDEIIALKEENETLIKTGIIMEMKEGLSLVEAEKFEKLASIVEFTRDEAFADKLKTIKESVKGAVEAEDTITESVKPEVKKSSYSHLV